MTSLPLHLEPLEDRCTPSLAAFTGLDIAVEQIYPTDPHNPIVVVPVFVLNYGDSVDITVPAGLNVALNFYPVDPHSPIFFGLADAEPPVVDG